MKTRCLPEAKPRLQRQSLRTLRHMVVYICSSSRDTHRGSQITHTEVASPSGLKDAWEWWRTCPPQLPAANAWHQRTLPHRQLSLLCLDHTAWNLGVTDFGGWRYFPEGLATNTSFAAPNCTGGGFLLCSPSPSPQWGSGQARWAYWTRKGEAQPSKCSARVCEEVGKKSFAGSKNTGRTHSKKTSLWQRCPELRPPFPAIRQPPLINIQSK